MKTDDNFLETKNIALQGTHPESWSELLVDLRYPPVQGTDGHLWNTHVSQGVYVTMFDPFNALDGQTPFG